MKRRILPIVAVCRRALSVTVACAGAGGCRRAEIFARLPQSVGNIAMTPDNQLIFSHHPFFSPDIRVAQADFANDVPAISERGLEHAEAGDRSIPRQRPRASIGRERHRLDHRHGVPDSRSRPSSLDGIRAPTSSNASTILPEPASASELAAAGHRDRPEEPEILHRR